jgi:DNA-binding transcriptional LysR family regulator
MRDNIPPLRQLRAFFAVAKSQSVTRAAQAINLSQPAVSQLIANLEAGLDAALFSRTPTGSYLTGPGEIFLARVQRVLDHMENALCDPVVGAPFASRDQVRAMLIRISSHHVRALLSIADSSSFDEAARLIGISQPSLQRAARELERIVERPLYHRTASGMKVTRPAFELARRLRIAMREVEYGVEEIEAARGLFTGRFTIGAIPLAGVSLLALALNDLLDAYPQTRIEIRDGRYEPMLAELRSGKVDILYGVLRCPAEIEDVTEIALFRDRYRIVVRRDHPLTCCGTVAIADLAAYDWILPGEGNPRRRVVEQLFADAAIQPRISIETSSIPAHKAILASSNRITLLTESEIKDRPDQLTALPFDGLAPRRPEGYAIRRDWKPTLIQQHFLELLQRHTQAWVAATPDGCAAEPAATGLIS